MSTTSSSRIIYPNTPSSQHFNNNNSNTHRRKQNNNKTPTTPAATRRRRQLHTTNTNINNTHTYKNVPSPEEMKQKIQSSRIRRAEQSIITTNTNNNNNNKVEKYKQGIELQSALVRIKFLEDELLELRAFADMEDRFSHNNNSNHNNKNDASAAAAYQRHQVEETNKKYKDLVQQQEDHIQELENYITELKTENMMMSKKEYHETMNCLQENLTRMQILDRELQTANREKLDSESQVEMFQQTLKDLEEFHKKEHQKKDSLIEKTQKQLDSSSAQLSSITKQLRDLQSKHNELLKSDTSRCQKDQVTMKKQLDHIRELKELLKQHTEKESTRTNYENVKVEEFKKQTTEANNKAQQLAMRVAVLEADRDGEKLRNTKLQFQVDERQSRVIELENRLAKEQNSHSKAFESLKSKYKQHVRDLATKSSATDSSSSQLAVLQTQNTKLQATEITLKKHLAAQKTELETANQTIAKLESSLNKYKEEKEKAEMMMTKEVTTNQTLNQQICDLKKQLEESRHCLQQKEQDFETKQQEHQSTLELMSTKLQESEGYVSELKAKLESNKLEFQRKLKGELSMSDSKLDALNIEIAKLKTELSRKSLNLSQLNQELEDMKCQKLTLEQNKAKRHKEQQLNDDNQLKLMNGLERSIVEHRNEIRRLKDELEVKLSENLVFSHTVDEYKNALSSVTSQLDDLKAREHTGSQKYEQLSKGHSELIEENELLQKSLDRTKDENFMLVSEKKSLELKVQTQWDMELEVSSQLKSKDEELQQLTLKNTQLHREVEGLRLEMEQISDERFHLQQSISQQQILVCKEQDDGSTSQPCISGYSESSTNCVSASGANNKIKGRSFMSKAREKVFGIDSSSDDTTMILETGVEVEFDEVIIRKRIEEEALWRYLEHRAERGDEESHVHD